MISRKDFRILWVYSAANEDVVAWHNRLLERRRARNFILFDLGSDSLLEPISHPEGRFRVTSYDPKKLAQTHIPGRHQYLLCREAFDSDVVINLPKLKTHRKAGLTAALKNLVGMNGNKDYLPHHRVGGSSLGGDCYKGLAPLKRLAELCLDQANQHIGTPRYQQWVGRVASLMRIQRKLGDMNIEGAWYGNDTIWRMSLDLNRILLYGRPDGTLADVPQRVTWSLTDALVCGQSEGPLASAPSWVGAVTFSSSAHAADVLHAALLGLDWKRIPFCRMPSIPSAGRWSHPSPESVLFTRGKSLLYQEMLSSLVPQPARRRAGLAIVNLFLKEKERFHENRHPSGPNGQ